MTTRLLKVLAVALAVYGASVAPGVHADTLEMHSVGESPANDAAGVLRPARGVSMESVRGRFGDPAEMLGPVGEPPITRWIYQDYTVYFEHNRVIHSVVHTGLRAAAQP